MSGTAEFDAAQAAPTEPSVTDQQPEAETASQPGAEQTPQTDAKPADPKATPDPRDRAIRQLAFEQRETRRQLQAAREALERVQPRDPNAQPSADDVARLVEQRAQALIEQRESQARSEAWLAKGNAEYEDFTARCNALADMGAADNGAFMTALGKVADGHKVIAELANDPAEATRILKLPPIDVALEVAALSARIAAAPPPPAKPVSRAPEPIRPIATAARAEVNLANLDGDAFRRAWNARKRG